MQPRLGVATWYATRGGWARASLRRLRFRLGPRLSRWLRKLAIRDPGTRLPRRALSHDVARRAGYEPGALRWSCDLVTRAVESDTLRGNVSPTSRPAAP